MQSSAGGLGRTHTSVFLIEAQALFVPALLDVFAEAGLETRGVSGNAEAHALLLTQPDVVFLDIDFIAQDPVNVVGMLRSLLPRSLIYIYTSAATWLTNSAFPGANAVFSKLADRGELVNLLRQRGLRCPA